MTTLPTFEADHRVGLHACAPCDACAICAVGAGDVVRLRDGQTITVESRYDWYEDREGRHDGPFVATAARERYLFSTVVEVVQKNPRVCVFCGGGVTATNPDTDFCRNCFYTGRASERALRPLLDRIDRIAEVSENASVWHTGGGCFNLAVHLADGRLLTLSVGYREADSGTVWPEPGFPDPGTDERWSMIVYASEDAYDEQDESRFWIPQALYTDDELVAAIRDIATGKTTSEATVAPCGCVALPDGTGVPCKAHHPDGRGVRRVLVHLNVEVPGSITAPTLAEDIAGELRGVLEVGLDEDHAPFLSESSVTVALAEEI